jgi:(p)ppGpp synthase/HD superfamily hydrolase
VTRLGPALAFAAQLHEHQKRKVSGVPFIAHPLAVAALVIEDGGSEDEAIAAVLHDSIEDQGRDYPGGPGALRAEIEKRFGGGVLRLVEGLTERRYPEEADIADKSQRWRAHKLAYLRQVAEAGPGACRISCADSLHNVRTLIRNQRRMGERIWERFLTRSRDDQVWAYGMAAAMYQRQGIGVMADELAGAVSELEKPGGLEYEPELDR